MYWVWPAHSPRVASSLDGSMTSLWYHLASVAQRVQNTLCDLSYAPEGIYDRDNKKIGAELLIRLSREGGWDSSPKSLLDDAIASSQTGFLAQKALQWSREYISFHPHERVQMNVYIWDLLDPYFIKSLEAFPYPENLVIEIVEVTQDMRYYRYDAVELMQNITRIKWKGVRFALDDFSMSLAAWDHELWLDQMYRRQSLKLYQFLSVSHGKEGRKSSMDVVKFDGPTMIRPLFDGDSSSNEHRRRLTSSLIQSMRWDGVTGFIAEFVQNSDEIRTLEALWFTQFQWRGLDQKSSQPRFH